jgi:hypothetical protein
VQFYINNVFDDDTVTSGSAGPGFASAQWRFGIADGSVIGPQVPSDGVANLPDPRIIGARFNWRFGN